MWRFGDLGGTEDPARESEVATEVRRKPRDWYPVRNSRQFKSKLRSIMSNTSDS